MFKKLFQDLLKKHGVRFLVRTAITLLNDYLIELEKNDQTNVNLHTPQTINNNVVTNDINNHM